ncbi:MAG: hypothetical protein EU529_12800 [Promethearchaeota archaeon]|nr:MAG: hypothetical protein EU529_12800 [Candidatus Lokiarchaeota archaeon]
MTLDYWEDKTDAIVNGDNLRDVNQISGKTFIDELGFKHIFFRKKLFHNPDYCIPKDHLNLFKKFLDGGSRSYPSDGKIPLDIIATEAKLIINKIIEISYNPEHIYYEDAKEALSKGKYNIVRGTVKIYLKKYTTRDWRRKRFSDDIDFWIHKVKLFEYTLKECGWKRNNKTKEWEKQLEWFNYETKQRNTGILIASNDINQAMDFGNCSYLDGCSLKDIFHKKLKRGHDVDLSDIINIALVQNKKYNTSEEWENSWKAIKEAINTRSKRTISNLISLCKYASAIADYIERVGDSIHMYKKLIFDKSMFPNSKLEEICHFSSHWTGYFHNNGPESTRSLIYSYLIEQQNKRIFYAENLRDFVREVLNYLNYKFQYAKIVFEIENK